MSRLRRSISFCGYYEEHIIGLNFSIHVEKSSPYVLSIYTKSQKKFYFPAVSWIRRENQEHSFLHQYTTEAKDSHHYHPKLSHKITHESLKDFAKYLQGIFDPNSSRLYFGRRDENLEAQELRINRQYLVDICHIASTKVRNRWFFGIAGKVVYLNNPYGGCSSYIVPDHFAQTINQANLKLRTHKISNVAFKEFIKKDLKRHDTAKINPFTSRSKDINDLYSGAKNPEQVFFHKEQKNDASTKLKFEAVTTSFGIASL